MCVRLSSLPPPPLQLAPHSFPPRGLQHQRSCSALRRPKYSAHGCCEIMSLPCPARYCAPAWLGMLKRFRLPHQLYPGHGKEINWTPMIIFCQFLVLRGGQTSSGVVKVYMEKPSNRTKVLSNVRVFVCVCEPRNS